MVLSSLSVTVPSSVVDICHPLTSLFPPLVPTTPRVRRVGEEGPPPRPHPSILSSCVRPRLVPGRVVPGRGDRATLRSDLSHSPLSTLCEWFRVVWGSRGPVFRSEPVRPEIQDQRNDGGTHKDQRPQLRHDRRPRPGGTGVQVDRVSSFTLTTPSSPLQDDRSVLGKTRRRSPCGGVTSSTREPGTGLCIRTPVTVHT